jgi:hypothetical protein
MFFADRVVPIDAAKVRGAKSPTRILIGYLRLYVFVNVC